MTPQKWIEPAVHIMSSFLMDHVLSQRHESPSWLRPSHRCAHTHTITHLYSAAYVETRLWHVGACPAPPRIAEVLWASRRLREIGPLHRTAQCRAWSLRVRSTVVRHGRRVWSAVIPRGRCLDLVPTKERGSKDHCVALRVQS